MAFAFLKKFIGRGIKRSLGIDIGTTSIKLVELAREGETTTLMNYGILEAAGSPHGANDALQASALKLFEDDAARYLSALLREANVHSKNAVASLPSFAVFSTVLDIPPMPDKEMSQMLQFKARQYIPLPLSSVSLDWIRIAEQKVLLFAVPNDLIEKHQSICKAAGLTLIALEAEGMSAARALGGETALVIDIGARSTGLFVIAGRVLERMSQTDFSGASLTRAIASSLGIAFARAEDLKRERGLINGGFGAGQELSTLLFPIVDVILNEAKRVRETYQSDQGKEIERVIIAGGGAQLPGLIEYAERFFGSPVAKAFPFKDMAYPAESSVILASISPRLTVAAGAALRGLL